MRQLSYTIEPEADGLSVNAYARNIAGLSRAFLRSVKFRENGILINGQRVTTRGVLHTGDCLVFNMPNDRTQKVVPAEGPVSIVFENEDIVLVNKIDVMPYFDFDLDKCREYVAMRNPKAKVIPICAKTGEGIDEWADWLKEQVREWQR